ETRRDRQVSADDAVAAQEAVLLVEEVHRAAAPLRRASLPAEELGHHRARVGAARQRVAMRPVRAYEVISRSQRGDRADDGGLLADVQVDIAADASLRILLGRALLEVPDELHLREHRDQLIARVTRYARVVRPLVFDDVGRRS